jgi:hypothetical protein
MNRSVGTFFKHKPSIRQMLERILANQEKEIMDLTALIAQVTQTTTVEASAVALIQQLAALIAANQNNPTQLAALVTQLNASATALAAAVTANTPAATNTSAPATTTTNPAPSGS